MQLLTHDKFNEIKTTRSTNLFEIFLDSHFHSHYLIYFKKVISLFAYTNDYI